MNWTIYPDAWIKVESSRLYYLKRQQHIFRTELYKGLMDHLEKKLTEIKNVEKFGKMIILPWSFTGTPRTLHENFIYGSSSQIWKTRFIYYDDL